MSSRRRRSRSSPTTASSTSFGTRRAPRLHAPQLPAARDRRAACDQGHRAQGTRGRPRRPCRAAAAPPPRPSAPLRRQELDLSGNKLMVLDGLEQFSTLKVLRAARNQITEVTIEKLPRLKILDLSHNKLDGLPDLCPPFRSNRAPPPPTTRRRTAAAAAARPPPPHARVRRPARRARSAGVGSGFKALTFADFSHNVSRRSLTIRSRMRRDERRRGADSQPPTATRSTSPPVCADDREPSRLGRVPPRTRAAPRRAAPPRPAPPRPASSQPASGRGARRRRRATAGRTSRTPRCSSSDARQQLAQATRSCSTTGARAKAFNEQVATLKDKKLRHMHVRGQRLRRGGRGVPHLDHLQLPASSTSTARR